MQGNNNIWVLCWSWLVDLLCGMLNCVYGKERVPLNSFVGMYAVMVVLRGCIHSVVWWRFALIVLWYRMWVICDWWGVGDGEMFLLCQGSSIVIRRWKYLVLFVGWRFGKSFVVGWPMEWKGSWIEPPTLFWYSWCLNSNCAFQLLKVYFSLCKSQVQTQLDQKIFSLSLYWPLGLPLPRNQIAGEYVGCDDHELGFDIYRWKTIHPLSPRTSLVCFLNQLNND